MGQLKHGAGGWARWALALALTATAAQAAPAGPARRLNAALLAQPSATAVLQQWCQARAIAVPPVIVARRDAQRKPADARVRALLRAGPGETIVYRHVRLACGDVVLSEADNWYRPALLTPAMNRELESTDHPFGAVVKPLDFHRRRLGEQFLSGAEVLRHRALLVLPDGAPLSLVVETYARAVIDAPSVGQQLKP